MKNIFTKITNMFSTADKNPDAENSVSFECNICKAKCTVASHLIGREIASCKKCGSTVRMRSIIHLLSLELFAESIPLPDFPSRPLLQGIGMSDWGGYAKLLTRKLGYTNTFYHKEPRLDITAIDPAREKTLDFVISTDVFEHILPPVSIAFENTFKLLKPGGVFIFTVPYVTENQTTIEHFPELHDFTLAKTGEEWLLHNVTKDGTKQVYSDLVFHGGEGATLETRLFSRDSLREEFARAGFAEVKICGESCARYGIIWDDDWSLPMVAKKSILKEQIESKR